MNKKEIIKTSPRATIYSYKSLGYSFSTAVADIIDNSIAADAKVINIVTDSEIKELYIIDDGKGMNLDELLIAMTPGGKDPTLEREINDLGRFGLGLKTASFSQCNLLKVVTKTKNGESLTRSWDIDYVLQEDEWQLFEGNITSEERQYLPVSGTIIKWSRFNIKGDTISQEEFDQNLTYAADYCRLVFHRYIQNNKIDLQINGISLIPFDPFFVGNDNVQRKPIETHSFGTIQSHILSIPKGNIHKNIKDNYDLIKGETQSQGVYVYRKDRLISYGDWFNYFKINELARLARVVVDYDSTKDEMWSLNVLKSKSIPPKGTAKIFCRIFKDSMEESRKSFIERGKRITKANPFTKTKVNEIWNTAVSKETGKFIYTINRKNEFLLDFAENNCIEKKVLFELLDVIEEFIPLEKIIDNNSENPSGHVREEFTLNDLIVNLAIRKKELMIQNGKSNLEVIQALQNMAPFSYYPELISSI